MKYASFRWLPFLLISVFSFPSCSKSSETPDSGATWTDGFLDFTLEGGVKDHALEQGTDQRQLLDILQDAPRFDLPEGASKMGWKVAQMLGHNLHAVSCVEGHLFAAGDHGTLVHRAPGSPGSSGFSPQAVPTTADLYTVSFADLTYGVTAGKAQEIWKTADQGKSWEIAPQCGSILFDTFYALHLDQANLGFGAGFINVKTDGGVKVGGAYKIYFGTLWICPEDITLNAIFYDVFRQGNQGWMVGDTNGLLFYTDANGNYWSTLPLMTQKPLHGVHVTPNGTVVAVGEGGAIVRGIENNTKWSLVKTLDPSDLYDVFFFDDKLGWAVGVGGTILHTTDGGVTWHNQMTPLELNLEAVCFHSATEGYAVGEKGIIYYTTTGGE